MSSQELFDMLYNDLDSKEENTKIEKNVLVIILLVQMMVYYIVQTVDICQIIILIWTQN